jgi:hypothetical protein
MSWGLSHRMLFLIVVVGLSTNPRPSSGGPHALS